MRPLCIVVAGEPIAETHERRGNFARLLRETVGDRWAGAWLEVDPRTGEPLPGSGEIAGVIISGSPHSVTERTPWMLRTEAWLRELIQARTPTLGVCFGHQLLGQALGGRVDRNPNGREIGTVCLELRAADALLDQSTPPFLANMTHVDSVLELPPGSRILASSAKEPHAAVRFSESAWGVQFHPEIDREIVGHYASGRRQALEAEGIDADGVMRSADDAKCGAQVLPRFVEHAVLGKV